MALAAVLLLPFALVDVPLVLDYPNHLARDFRAGASGRSHPVALLCAALENPAQSGFRSASAWRCLKILPVHAGGRLLLALSLLAPPLGVLAYSRAAFGRIDRLGIGLQPDGLQRRVLSWFHEFPAGAGPGARGAGLWLALRRRGWAQAVADGRGGIGGAVLLPYFRRAALCAADRIGGNRNLVARAPCPEPVCHCAPGGAAGAEFGARGDPLCLEPPVRQRRGGAGMARIFPTRRGKFSRLS